MGGGSRPWIGKPEKVKVKSAVGREIVLESYDAGPSDLKAGDDYVVVFHTLNGRDRGGDGGKVGDAKS